MRNSEFVEKFFFSLKEKITKCAEVKIICNGKKLILKVSISTHRYIFLFVKSSKNTYEEHLDRRR